MYKPNEIITQMKLGVVIRRNGELRIQDSIVRFGISVIPGGRDLSTYNGGSPKYFPRTIPNIFSIFAILNLNIFFTSGNQ